jgi:hypothetical protein
MKWKPTHKRTIPNIGRTTIGIIFVASIPSLTPRRSGRNWVVLRMLGRNTLRVYDRVPFRGGHPLLGVHCHLLDGCGDGGCWDYKGS